MDVARELVLNQDAQLDHANADGCRPMHFAYERSLLAMMRLLDAKNDPNTQTAPGWTPRHYAALS